MATNYDRIVKDDPTASMALDHNALAFVLGMMTRDKIRGLTLTKRLRWVAHVQRDGVLHQKEFAYSDKAQAIAWLLCTRAQLQLEGKDTDQCGRWKRNPEVAK
ncbi:hypothetical protein [Pseudomonas hunanensis]|uniref:hypothetical protein n=1 Tax=Pseudomonas hunanensis TaxID=1247546 RepID=UPI002405A3F6|nr:hypothetical protein [Pseudomonas hunanensis]MDF9755544.1 hypothetical protein [Pseudomonas hunanensis]